MMKKFANLLRKTARNIGFPVYAPMRFKHRVDEAGCHHVEMHGLKVWIHHNGSAWIAQGLDIAYATAGSSVDEAKKLFELGLGMTLFDHLQTYQSVERVIKRAPPDVWRAWRRDFWRSRRRHALVTSPVRTRDGRALDFFPAPKVVGCYFEPRLV